MNDIKNETHNMPYGEVPAAPLQDQLMYADLMKYHKNSGNAQSGKGVVNSIKEFIGNLLAAGASSYFDPKKNPQNKQRGNGLREFTVNDAREAYKKLVKFNKFTNFLIKSQGGKGASIKVPQDSNNYHNVMRKAANGISF